MIVYIFFTNNEVLIAREYFLDGCKVGPYRIINCENAEFIETNAYVRLPDCFVEFVSSHIDRYGYLYIDGRNIDENTVGTLLHNLNKMGYRPRAARVKKIEKVNQI